MKSLRRNDGLCSNCEAAPTNRRDFLARSGLGIGSLGLAMLLADPRVAPAANDELDPLAPKQPHFAPKAKRLVQVFLSGGPTHIDLYESKPELQKQSGKPYPAWKGILWGSPFKFAKQGRSGLEMSELFAKCAAHADDLCIVRSMKTDIPAHLQAGKMLATGSTQLTRPSVGSWVTYGLGTECRNLPAFVALGRVGDPQLLGSAFLPPVHQGTIVNVGRGEALPNLKNSGLTPAEQQKQLAVLERLNRKFDATAPHEAALEARIRSFELAYQMQSAAPEAFDLASEPAKTQEAYDLTTNLGRQLLAARRLLERGVRVVQVWDGGWDHHNNLVERARKSAGDLDTALAAFLTDLKRMGLLEDTLIVVGGEFGRTPVSQAGLDGDNMGRDHNHLGFGTILAGGGIQGGLAYGSTDPLGREAVENKVHVHDLHATLLHCLGFDHTKLTYRYSGRDFRLTDVHGTVVKGILS